MAFYNNAFKKVMLGTGNTIQGATVDFIVTAPNLTLSQIADLGAGYIAILNPTTYKSINPLSATGPIDFIVANTSLLQKDKYGPHGGYQMCDLSKLVRSSYASKAYRVDVANSHPYVLGIGANSINGTNEGCTPAFFCDQSLIFRVDIGGGPVLRNYTRNLYRWINVKTPCCSEGTVSRIDPTWVFIQIAEAIIKDPYLSQFIVPVVYSNGANGINGVNYIAPSSYDVSYPSIVTATNSWDTYVIGSSVNIEDVEAGIILIGAYSDTTFSNCSFQESDFESVELVKVYADFVDMDGNPCETLKYCKNVLSRGYQGNGYGTTLQKDLLISQAYLRNYLSEDPRIREVNGGIDLLIDRTKKYYRFGFIHTIPRFLGGGNDSNLGLFNTDRYVIEIATPFPILNNNGSGILNQFLGTVFPVYDTTSGASNFTGITIS